MAALTTWSADLDRPTYLRRLESAAGAEQISRYAEDQTSATRALIAAGVDPSTAVVHARTVLADLVQRGRLG